MTVLQSWLAGIETNFTTYAERRGKSRIQAGIQGIAGV
jgi:hypothetical protein